MKILLDTNVFIPLEPTGASPLEDGSRLAVDLLRTAQDIGARIYVHPVQRHDLAQDTNVERRSLRELLFQKYVELPDPPVPSPDLLHLFGDPEEHTNHWIDCHLLAAVDRSAVILFVTEDKQLRRRAARVGLASHCLGLAGALELLRAEKIHVPPTLPAVVSLKAHNLNEADSIFDSIRQDYDGFDKWLQKCREEHRQCWVVQIGSRSDYAGMVIIHKQPPPCDLLKAPCLKICTFKIADNDTGYKLGELLLRSVFDFTNENGFASAFIESSPDQAALLFVLKQFGFQELGTKPGTQDELVLGKRFSAPACELNPLPPVEINRRFGPHLFSWDKISSYVIPIEPQFHDALFPDLADTGDLLTASRPYSNAMRKAYLCKSNTITISPGDLLWFYRSQDHRSITALGIAEETIRSSEAEELARFLGNRTVYPKEQIQEMCCAREALGILFRYVPIAIQPISLQTLTEAGVLKAAPQTITKLAPTNHQWLRTHLS